MGDRGHVLVVDDDFEFVVTLSDILEATGFAVATANDGLEAIEKVKEEAFDCVLMDIKMAGIDGVEACREIRRVRPEARVVLMTGYVSEELSQKGLDDGAAEILYKPFDYKQLISAVQGQPK